LSTRNKSIINHQNCPQGNGRIGNIERREVVAMIVMHLDKVNHVTEQQHVPQIAQGAAEDERQRQFLQNIPLTETKQPDNQNNADAHRNQDKKPTLPTACIAEETECSALIMEQRPVEKRQNLNGLTIRKNLRRQQLGGLIQGNQQNSQQQPKP